MRILIATPTYDRRIDIEIVRTIINLEREKKHDYDYIFPVSSHLARNRNLACQEALNACHDWLLFWDSDIGIQDTGFIDKMIETAFKFDAQIVCGAYRIKDPAKSKYAAGLKIWDKYENLESITQRQLIDAGGTGIMLIQRKVLETMAEPWFTIVDGKNLFVMPEDYEFCRKAQELGFKIAVDPRFETRHYGQFAWMHTLFAS